MKGASVLLTVLEPNDALARALGEEISRLGADHQAHFWQDGPEHQAFAPVIRELERDRYGVWIIAGTSASWQRKSVRQGLALTALGACQGRQRQGIGPLSILISCDGAGMTTEDLPAPLTGAEFVSRGLGAKAVARLHAPQKTRHLPCRLNVHALPGLGLWLECGPSSEPWQGALLGACGAEPDAHGVGQAGIIPDRCTLHHPVRGIRLEAGERDFTAWGVMNGLSPAESYYVRLDGLPDALVFGPFPQDDDPELHILSLC